MIPYQEQLRMIREGFIAALADLTQGPLITAAMVAALEEAGLGVELTPEQEAALALALTAVQPASLRPYYDIVSNVDAALDLSMDHDGKLIYSSDTAPVLTLRKQATYEWGTRCMITLMGVNDFKIQPEDDEVTLGGDATGTAWDCVGGTGATVLIKSPSSTNVWLIGGPATLETP